MSNIGRAIGLIAALGMFLFSVFIYVNTGDWVAAVFAVGSLAYGIFFWTASSRVGSDT